MSIEFASLTNVGRVRDHNEDSFTCDGELKLFVVCDGMGGHAAGEVASEIAANTVREVIAANHGVIEEFEKAQTVQARNAVAALVVQAGEKACARVYEAATADAGKAGMGTTLEMVLVAGHTGFMGHVGDSRLYVKRGGEVHQLSEDHSFVNEMVRAGHMTEQEARNSPVASVITRAVGVQETVQVDTLVFDILPGDTLLLCSDGLSDYVETESKLAQLLTDDPLEVNAERLVEYANERGGKDNITTVLIRALEDEEPERVARTRDVDLRMETLKRVRLFKHLTYKELVMLLSITEREAHEEGVALISEGERDSAFYVVLEGRVEVAGHGHQLAVLEQGDHFGEMELITPRARSATVSTLTESTFLVIRRSDFIALLKANEHLAVKLLWSFLQTMSVRLFETNKQLLQAIDEEEATAPF